ncbi:hypothetical protein FNU79_11185 [Deinococcus detaillensis]|uniref:Uncharacterized protein n=1 Tax=Deinococcus detaillensis TaxID=2592048 RepID=A0A553UWD7_9DEIO|nr:hypothetical protein [Deinococcus detaillensis]TSA84515.1 hypothetical protein FNU79_11185 [Deinococcus detaillensis]
MKTAAPRLIASLVAGLATALILYGVFLSDGRPFPYHNRVPDAELAFKMIPLELLIGLLIGWLVYGLFGRRQAAAPRRDIQERMVYRFAHRRGGAFTLPELETQSPLSAEQARQVVEKLLEAGRLSREGETYRLS